MRSSIEHEKFAVESKMRTTPKLARSLADPFSYCDGVNNSPVGSADLKWRDWANLLEDLIEEITSRLLALDIVNYTHFQATCKRWRDCTDDPRVCGVMDSRFRPRDWVELSLSDSRMLPTFLNTNTLARVVVDFPAELTTHRHLGTADGLIILGHKATNVIYILNPLTRLVVKFPTITIEQAMKVSSVYTPFPNISEMGMLHVDQSDIIGARIDDSTSTPTLVLRLRHESCQVICAKPGDRHWVSVSMQDGVRFPPTSFDGVRYDSPTSFKGRCYFVTQRGVIMVVDLSPMNGPRMVPLLEETPPMANGSDNTNISSTLARCKDRMLMIRPKEDGYNETQMFLLRQPPSCVSPSCLRPSSVEMFKVDVEGRRFVPWRNGVSFIRENNNVKVFTKKWQFDILRCR